MHDILQHDIIKYGINEPIHLLSLGAGVQSSTLALMAARGEVRGYPKQIHGAIFADTQDEPASVYKWLDWLEQEICRSPFPFPLYRVTAGKLSEESTRLFKSKDGRTITRTSIPFFTSDDGAAGKIPGRGCTADFKIKPILNKAKELAGVARGQKYISVIQWIGISLDEVHRMKPSRDPWAECAWPLVDMRMTRHDCLLWMQRNGYPKPPRSSCVFCPYHSNAEWRRLRDEEPEAFAAAVEFERRLQETKAATDNMRAVPYLHRSLVPLDKVDLSTLEDHGQMSLFGNECTGMCGV
jgi:hypothetical protein